MARAARASARVAAGTIPDSPNGPANGHVVIHRSLNNRKVEEGGDVGSKLGVVFSARRHGIALVCPFDDARWQCRVHRPRRRDGLGPAWGIRRAFWKDRAAYEDKVFPGFTSLEGAKARHLGSSPHTDRYDPETWEWEAALLARPGQRQIQSDLFFDYQTNVADYPSWQAWLKDRCPPLLVLWGRYDPSFALAEAQAYQRDIPDAEVHILDAGHFALDEKADEVATLIRDFFAKRKI
jgi:pimeloyl-ACP methyl ester carboxylesterase